MLAVAVATGRTYLAAAAELPGPVPSLPGTIARTVEVYPDAKKNKAFPLELGSGICDLTLRAESPWRIRDSSIINPVSDETIWKKFSPTRYKMATYGHAPGEFVQIEGDLYKPSSGSGEVKPELPEFLVTVPSVNLDWDAKHGEAAKEFAEDSVPAAILVSSDRADFGSLIVYGPKDDFNISSSDVTLSWDNANKVKVYDGAIEIRSGHKFSIMQGASKTLLVEALEPAPDVKFTLEGEPDNVNRERAVDYVHACCGRCEFIAYVDQPERGTRTVFNPPADVGHAFWELRTDIRPVCFDAEYRRYIGVAMGFYPDQFALTFEDVRGKFVLPDVNHANSVDSTRTWVISIQRFLSGLRFCRDFERSVNNGMILYNIVSYNCALATINAAAACGVRIPSTLGRFPLFDDVEGPNPGDLGEDIRSL